MALIIRLLPTHIATIGLVRVCCAILLVAVLTIFNSDFHGLVIYLDYMDWFDWLMTVLVVLFIGIPVFLILFFVVFELVAYIIIFIKGGVKAVGEKLKKQIKAVS
jgi:hypothetical protein